MRRLTDEDLAGIVGRTIQGYDVEAAKIKRGPHIDSDNYGFILGKNRVNEYKSAFFAATNQFAIFLPFPSNDRRFAPLLCYTKQGRALFALPVIFLLIFCEIE